MTEHLVSSLCAFQNWNPVFFLNLFLANILDSIYFITDELIDMVRSQQTLTGLHVSSASETCKDALVTTVGVIAITQTTAYQVNKIQVSNEYVNKQ